jgi:hypothetical protein
MHITKQCTIKFAISDKYVDEVTCDVVSLKECGIVLGSPYLYDHKQSSIEQRISINSLKKVMIIWCMLIMLKQVKHFKQWNS